MISSGRHTFRNYLIFKIWPVNRVFKLGLGAAAKDRVEGINLGDTRAVKEAVSVPVLCTGGFQTASVSRPRSSAATATASRSAGR